MKIENIREIVDTIIKDNENIELIIPLSDIVWTIVVFYYRLYMLDEEIQSNPQSDKMWSLKMNKECMASRSDELARIINQYSDFDTQHIWETLKSYQKEI